MRCKVIEFIVSKLVYVLLKFRLFLITFVEIMSLRVIKMNNYANRQLPIERFNYR